MGKSKGSGSLYRRKYKDKNGKVKESPIYWMKYYQNGKAVYESTGELVWAEAKNKLNERLGVIARGKPAGIRFDKVMLSELIEDLKADYKLHNKQHPRTKHLEDFFDGYRVIDVTTSKIIKYINYRKESGAASGTINRELAALKRLLRIGAKTTPPKVDRIPNIPKLEEDNVKQGFFEDEDFHALLEHLSEYMKGLVSFAYWTGWRKGQILKLEWSMVNIKERIISVPGSITKNKKPHIIYLNDPLLEIIRDRRSRTRLDSPYVFHLDGKQVANFRRAWNTACRNAKLEYGYKLTLADAEKWKRKNLKPGPTFHDLRRTAARNLIRSGVTESVVMKITGHRTRAIFERYNITTTEELKHAAELQAKNANGYNYGDNSEKSAEKVTTI